MPVLHQLAANFRTDRFGAAQLVLAADRVLDQLDRDLLAPFGALVQAHLDLGSVGIATRQLSFLDGEADTAHRITPPDRVHCGRRGEFDVTADRQARTA